MFARILIFLAATSISGPAHGLGLEAPPVTAPPCPAAAGDAPPGLPSGAPVPQDDFRLIYSCANPAPGV